jgi:hypothetical protein
MAVAPIGKAHAQSILTDEDAVKSCVAAQVKDYKDAGATVTVKDIDEWRVNCSWASLIAKGLAEKTKQDEEQAKRKADIDKEQAKRKAGIVDKDGQKEIDNWMNKNSFPDLR